MIKSIQLILYLSAIEIQAVDLSYRSWQRAMHEHWVSATGHALKKWVAQTQNSKICSGGRRTQNATFCKMAKLGINTRIVRIFSPHVYSSYQTLKKLKSSCKLAKLRQQISPPQIWCETIRDFKMWKVNPFVSCKYSKFMLLCFMQISTPFLALTEVFVKTFKTLAVPMWFFPPFYYRLLW